MNDERDNLDAGLDTENLCIAALLRACADGELCPEQCERLKKYLAQHPEAAGQVEFEKALKESCQRVLGPGCGCPDSLRNKIEAMACECMKTSEIEASGIEASNERTRKASFWKLNPAMSAMAAVLVLAGGALIWQSSSIITQNSGLGNQTTLVTYAERMGDFVAREHTRCCQEGAGSRKLKIQDLEEATAYFSGEFGRAVQLPGLGESEGGSEGQSKGESGGELGGELREGIKFFGGGDCHMPATERSGHMRFDMTDAQGQVTHMSLFVAPDPGLLEIQAGVTYMVNSTSCSQQGANLFAWVADGVMYVLVSEADGEMCAKVRGMMNAPTKLQQL